ncbi:MAG TPA: response regulator [Nitrososphaera sp.]|jgi:DNA-binding NtrC family response regulator|nr:response regulator [Nitrososphaera sp.]
MPHHNVYKLQQRLVRKNNEKTTILIVDDDIDILTVTGRSLEHAGFKVHAFVDPLTALHHVRNDCKYCQVLVSDIRMPGLTGFQLVRKVKDLRPEMKVIMMTMFEVNKPEFEAVFPSTPIDAVIRKPFTPSQLVEKIRGFLGAMAQGTTRRVGIHGPS